ncbi:MAG: hypothetical protein AAF417_10575 [Pseudomonadota bacterium]
MNELTRHLWRGAAAAGFLVFAACGSQPQQPVQEQSAVTANYFIGTQTVYAHLNQEGGGSWVFKTVTEADAAPAKGYLVRLNDLSPAFDVRIAECEPQAYPANHKCNPSQPFREKDIGVVKKLINSGIAAGTAGKVTGVSRTYRTAFDEGAFNRAVDEALTNTGLENQRREFLITLDRHRELLAQGRARLASDRKRALSLYRDTRQVALDIDARIDGLREYYSNDVDFRDIVTLQPLDVRRESDSSLQAETLLPCDARQCAQKARTAIAELQSKLNERSEQQTSSLVAQTTNYAVNCTTSSHAGYTFALECPEQVTATSDGASLPITMTILSRDFSSLYPEFELGDERLKIETDGDRVRFINQTQNYLSVRTQTIYYNTHVETHRKRIDIAPGVAIERHIDDFVTPAIRIESTLRDMTPGKAGGTTFRFGMAASYRVAAEDGEATLYDLREFNARCVIDNRLRPGSCQESISLVDTTDEADETNDTDSVDVGSYRVEEYMDLPMPRD